ncbi:MAG: hypothetical protein IBJ09_16340 [Bacteroidia bacterium]|nr:hypothetical protein [Bacteroidia bacterium]
MKKILLFFIPLMPLLTACNGLRNETDSVIGKSGEVVGKSAGEFFSGVGEGVEKTLDCKVILSDELKNKGLSTGVYTVESSVGGAQNVFTLYLIFARDFSGDVQALVKDPAGAEKGRVTRSISDKAGNAGYTEFAFDPRTNIESKNVIELSLLK